MQFHINYPFRSRTISTRHYLNSLTTTGTVCPSD